MLRLIEERIRSSEIEVEHRDVLIRLRAMIEEDLAEPGRGEPENSHSAPVRAEPLADSDA